jgi:TolB-like protein
MIYLFEDFQLDTDKVELSSGGEEIPLEPQVFALLRLLIENRDRMVSKDEIIERIWNGRIVSDSAVASRIKSARHAVCDDGRAQRVIRTLHGLGFRFVAKASVAEARLINPAKPASADVQPLPPPPRSTRPTIAVLPFRLLGDPGPHGVIAEALPDDLITQLSRLRWLFVIARGSSFRFRGDDADIAKARDALNVRYCITGVVEVFNNAMTVSVELSDTSNRGSLWSERFQAELGAVHEIRDEIVRAAISALELQIPLNEARGARLISPDHLDAWSAYHLALQRMYRFNREDNAAATALLQRAVALEPDFARAYAGLSFTYFQDAFLRYAGDVQEATRLAQHYAELSLEHDPLDPFGNFTMGRTFILRGDIEGSLPWLDRANVLNPNYAQGKYSRAWSEALLTPGKAAQANIDDALTLSPLDPLRYAMLSVRAFMHMGRDELAEAARWADEAARSPNAHVLIDLIATASHGLNGDDASARLWAETARARRPDVSTTDFFRAFPFRDGAIRRRISLALGRYGF